MGTGEGKTLMVSVPTTFHPSVGVDENRPRLSQDCGYRRGMNNHGQGERCSPATDLTERVRTQKLDLVVDGSVKGQ